jgi:hypothetical protein
MSANVQYDSWLSVGISKFTRNLSLPVFWAPFFDRLLCDHKADGDSGGAISSIGIDWDTWTVSSHESHLSLLVSSWVGF